MKKLNSLEKAVINKFLESNNMEPLSDNVLHNVIVESRSFTQIGFMTKIETPSLLHCPVLPANFTGGNVGAQINQGQIEAGFVMYLEDNTIRAIEGYDTSNELWPTEISSFSLYLHNYGNESDVNGQ